jgi:hypothetical protein
MFKNYVEELHTRAKRSRRCTAKTGKVITNSRSEVEFSSARGERSRGGGKHFCDCRYAWSTFSNKYDCRNIQEALGIGDTVNREA